jgi:hypothetical protein
MKNSVKVTADNSGAVVIPSKNNPVYGYIRVEQKRTIMNEQGWVETRTLSALLNGEVDVLKSLNYRPNQSLEGTIRIVERMEPFNKKFPKKNIKIAGDSGVVCTIEGEPIYRNCFYSEDPEAEDILVQHDNTEEIRAKVALLKEAGADLSN